MKRVYLQKLQSIRSSERRSFVVLEVLGTKNVSVVLFLALAAGCHRDGTIGLNVGPVQSVGVGRLQNGSLRVGQALVHWRGPTSSFVSKVRSTVDVRGGRKPVQADAPLPIAGRPGQGPVHRAFGEQHDVAGSGRGLLNEFRVGLSVDHARRHFEIGLVRSRNDAKASVSSVVVRQHDVDAQQCGADRAVVTAVGQVGIVLARGAINRSTVQLKAFRTVILRNDKRQVVHVVALSQNAVKERYEPRVRQNGLEDGTVAVRLPFQHASQIFATRARAVHRAALDGVAERSRLARHHEVLAGVNRGIGRRHFFLGQNVANNQKAIQVK